MHPALWPFSFSGLLPAEKNLPLQVGSGSLWKHLPLWYLQFVRTHAGRFLLLCLLGIVSSLLLSSLIKSISAFFEKSDQHEK
jgi:hypothetical protein